MYVFPIGARIYQKNQATNEDIRKVLELPSIMQNAMLQTKRAAEVLRGKTPRQTYYNIWCYLKNNIKYKEDGIKSQNIKLPSRFVKDLEGDCKSYSLFTAAILKNLGENCYWTYASYSDDPTPQHVYITCQDGTIIDGVYTAFNQEKPPRHKYKKIVK